jgi:hypothetical protein
MPLEQVVNLVRDPFPSMLGTAIAEGIVARPIGTLFDRRGERIIIKLKTRDFAPRKAVRVSEGERGKPSEPSR